MTFFPQLYFSGRTRTLHVSIRLQRWSFEPCHMRARRKTGRNISSIVQNKDISYIHILYWLFNDKLSSSTDKHIQKMILHSVWKWFSKSLIGIFTKSCKGQFVVKWDFLILFQTLCDTYANFRYTKKEAWVVVGMINGWRIVEAWSWSQMILLLIFMPARCHCSMDFNHASKNTLIWLTP